MDFLKVSGQSLPPHPLPARLPDSIKDGNPVRIQSIGAGAVNQAVKGHRHRTWMAFAPSGIDVACVPSLRRASR